MFRCLSIPLGLALVTISNVSAASSVQIFDAWSRPAMDTAVIYTTIVNGGTHPDRLIGATSPMAARVEIDEGVTTTSPGAPIEGMPSHIQTMTIRPLSELSLPPHGIVILSPGGYELQLIGLVHPLRVGKSVPLRLHFAQAGWISTSAHVRAFDRSETVRLGPVSRFPLPVSRAR